MNNLNKLFEKDEVEQFTEGNFKVIHNGYKIMYLKSNHEVIDYMKGVLANHLNLEPRRIMDRTFSSAGNNKNNQGKVRIIRFMYTTLYEEDFIIEY